jgi:hypothetical protein
VQSLLRVTELVPFLRRWRPFDPLGLLPLVLVGIGAFGRVPGRTLWLSAPVFGLVVLQSVLIAPYRSAATGWVRAIAGLHVVNGLLVFWVSLKLLERVTQLSSQAAARDTPDRKILPDPATRLRQPGHRPGIEVAVGAGEPGSGGRAPTPRRAVAPGVREAVRLAGQGRPASHWLD